MSIESRMKYNNAILTYKALNDMTTDYIAELPTPMSQTHSRHLRSRESGELYVPYLHTKLYKGTFSCSAPRLWNSLPETARNSESFYVFKTNVKSAC